MFRKIAMTALGAAVIVTAPVSALAMPRGNGLPVVKTESVQLAGHRHKRRYYRRRYYDDDYRYRHRRYRHRHNDAAIVLGIIGLGTALAIANSNRYHHHQNGYYNYSSGSSDWKAACARKYRSFEWHTGLYTTYRGYKRRCRLP